MDEAGRAHYDGGGRGIRTPVTLAGKAVFKTACFNRSHIPPRMGTRLLSPLYDGHPLARFPSVVYWLSICIFRASLQSSLRDLSALVTGLIGCSGCGTPDSVSVMHPFSVLHSQHPPFGGTLSCQRFTPRLSGVDSSPETGLEPFHGSFLVALDGSRRYISGQACIASRRQTQYRN